MLFLLPRASIPNPTQRSTAIRALTGGANRLGSEAAAKLRPGIDSLPPDVRFPAPFLVEVIWFEIQLIAIAEHHLVAGRDRPMKINPYQPDVAAVLRCDRLSCAGSRLSQA